jgi:hypothetical protein
VNYWDSFVNREHSVIEESEKTNLIFLIKTVWPMVFVAG